MLKNLRDCEEFIAGDGSILRELLHPDKADVPIRYSLAHAKVPAGRRTAELPASLSRWRRAAIAVRVAQVGGCTALKQKMPKGLDARYHNWILP